MEVVFDGAEFYLRYNWNNKQYWKPLRFYFNFDSTSRLYFVFSFLSSPSLIRCRLRDDVEEEKRKIFHNESTVATALHETQRIINPIWKILLNLPRHSRNFVARLLLAGICCLQKIIKTRFESKEGRSEKTFKQMSLRRSKVSVLFEYKKLQK